MYGMLWNIIREYIHFDDPILAKFDGNKYAEVCETNFHAGIETYELLVDPTFDNAFALMLAVRKCPAILKRKLTGAGQQSTRRRQDDTLLDPSLLSCATSPGPGLPPRGHIEK